MLYLDNIYIICRIYNCNRIGGVMVDRVKPFRLWNWYLLLLR